MNLQPYNWLTLDIETKGGRPENAERDMRMNWSPDRRWKPETIGTKYLENLAKREERLALIDGSEVISIALRSDTELRCLHALYAHAPNQLDKALIEGFATQREMLIALRGLLDTRVAPDTTLVGHNLLDFDLPKLRMAYLREGLKLPACLAGPCEVYDTMREWGKRFSATRDCYCSVADVWEVLGIENHKNLVDGADVEKLYTAGQHDLLIKYNLLDALTEAELFQRMTGQAADAAPRHLPTPTPTPAAQAATEYATTAADLAQPDPAPKRRKLE